MSVSGNSNLVKKTPSWVWFSFIPVFGGLAISYAGHKANTQNWVKLGAGITVAAVLLSSTELAFLIWISQIGTSFYLKKQFLLNTSTRGMTEGRSAGLVAEANQPIDINTCSKDELVYSLGLPIVYANDIELVRNEGYIFTHLEELTEIAGIPENILSRIAPLIVFTYDYKKEDDFSWRRINSLSVSELVTQGLEASMAQKIVQERQRGTYKSLLDVRKRTGLPLSAYKHLF